jgi:hypothetical protein
MTSCSASKLSSKQQNSLSMKGYISDCISRKTCSVLEVPSLRQITLIPLLLFVRIGVRAVIGADNQEEKGI